MDDFIQKPEKEEAWKLRESLSPSESSVEVRLEGLSFTGPSTFLSTQSRFFLLCLMMDRLATVAIAAINRGAAVAAFLAAAQMVLSRIS